LLYRFQSLHLGKKIDRVSDFFEKLAPKTEGSI